MLKKCSVLDHEGRGKSLDFLLTCVELLSEVGPRPKKQVQEPKEKGRSAAKSHLGQRER